MAFLCSNVRFGFAWPKFFNFANQLQKYTLKKRRKKNFCSALLESKPKLLAPRKLTHSSCRFMSNAFSQLSQGFESSPVSCSGITEEILFFRDARNEFSQTCFSDPKEPYGPPLAILLPWKTLHENNLKRFIEIYTEKGFDVLTVNLTPQQIMYPCIAGGAMNVVSDLLQYLNEAQKNRPFIFHGFSVGAYIYGEIMAQFSDQYENYRAMMNNVKGCLWDSPVDICTVKPCVGKFFYPKNWFRRWRCNRAVSRHFKNHNHDSVFYWLRARENFCNPIIKVPNVFFVSYTDMMSNPNSLQSAQKILDCNGVPIFQKTWWDSQHTCHFDKYCYEYLYGMVLFLNLSNLFPDDCGKYRCGCKSSSLTNLRLSKKARENICA